MQLAAESIRIAQFVIVLGIDVGRHLAWRSWTSETAAAVCEPGGAEAALVATCDGS